MMKRNALRAVVPVLLLMFTVQTATADIRIKGIQVQAGASYPGIIDDKIDGTTGASLWGVTAGAHSRIKVGGHTFETGIDFTSGSQRFESDASGDYLETDWIQIAVPLSYNFCLFNRRDNGPLLEIKLGFVPGYFQPIGPDYSDRADSVGFENIFIAPLIGFQLTPFTFGPYRAGLGLSMFRSFTKVLDDSVFADEYGQLSSFSVYMTLEYGL